MEIYDSNFAEGLNRSMEKSSNCCVVCSVPVRKRHEGVQCDRCNRSQHRICNSGSSRALYRKLVKRSEEIDEWLCYDCKNSKKVSTSSVFCMLTPFLQNFLNQGFSQPQGVRQLYLGGERMLKYSHWSCLCPVKCHQLIE